MHTGPDLGLKEWLGGLVTPGHLEDLQGLDVVPMLKASASASASWPSSFFISAEEMRRFGAGCGEESVTGKRGCRRGGSCGALAHRDTRSAAWAEIEATGCGVSGVWHPVVALRASSTCQEQSGKW